MATKTVEAMDMLEALITQHGPSAVFNMLAEVCRERVNEHKAAVGEDQAVMILEALSDLVW